MGNIGNSLVSSSSRPLRVRVRRDLVADEQVYQGRKYYVLKDPVSLKYYRFEEEEYALLQMLDGGASADEIKRQFERRFTPQKLTLAELHQFVGMLYRSALVTSDAAGQGQQLLQRHHETTKQQRFGSLTNILAVRLRGFNPDRLLNLLNGHVGWFFSWPAVIASLMFGLAALLLITAEFDVFRAKLPQFREFFAVHNWLWIAVTLGITKVLHEFGHGLACKRQGGECHEMGIMFLVLMPCLYCNVSDSWMLPGKWRRAAIGAAGMYVEILLASVATFLWWFSQPGFFNSLCLNVMFVCSVSTLIFNANPLLRYDGYYILSDLLEIPNLRSKASSILQRKLGKWMLGLPEPYDPFLPQRQQWLFALYSVAAFAYRWLVTLTIFWFIYHLSEPYGFKIVGQIMSCIAVGMLVVMPLWQLAKFFYIPGRIDQVNKLRMAVSIASIAAVLAAVAWIPVPHHVSGSLHIQPRDASVVYVDVPGNVRMIHCQADEPIVEGELLVTLENLDEWLAITRLERGLVEEKTLLASLERAAREGDDGAALQLNGVEQSIATMQEMLRKRIDDFERLIIKAPCSGQIIPAVYRKPQDDEDRLGAWSGTPLEPHNLGAFLQKGTPICQIGNPRNLEAILVIDQTNIEFVGPGQRVEVFLDHLPGRQFESGVEHISEMEMKDSPRSLSSKSGGELMTRTDRFGRERLLETAFQVSAPLDDDDGILRIGARGYGKIRVGNQTIGWRVWRYLSHTFSFEM